MKHRDEKDPETIREVRPTLGGFKLGIPKHLICIPAHVKRTPIYHLPHRQKLAYADQITSILTKNVVQGVRKSEENVYSESSALKIHAHPLDI